jgi:hypothetical protein
MTEELDFEPKINTWWFLGLAIVLCFGLAGLLIYAVAVDSASVFAAGLLTAFGALVAGGFFGFLFGIPRLLLSGGSDPSSGFLRSSTSLEEIADWLTKILVGLGLASLGTLATRIGNLIDFLAPALGPEPYRRTVALGILLLFSISGFLLFYLTTRIHIAEALAITELKLRRKEARAVGAVDTLKVNPVASDSVNDFLAQVRAEK